MKVLAIVLVMAAIPVAVAFYFPLKRRLVRKRRSRLRSRPLPDGVEEVLARNIGLYALLPDDLQAELHGHIIATATTDPATPGTSITIGSFVVTTDGIGQGFKVGRADIVVEDENGNPIDGALVTGDFSGTFNETISNAPTDANGLVVVMTDEANAAKGKVSVTFCVSSITHPSYTSLVGPVCSSN